MYLWGVYTDGENISIRQDRVGNSQSLRAMRARGTILLIVEKSSPTLKQRLQVKKSAKCGAFLYVAQMPMEFVWATHGQTFTLKILK
jgi:hypothetical protein